MIQNKLKTFLTTLAVIILIVASFFLIQKRDTKKLDGSRIALIDTVGNNYIFRGSNPFVIKGDETVFAHEELTNYFNQILNNQGAKTLNDYYLVDVSLLDFEQFFAIKKEKKFFLDHPEYGKMISISTLSPTLLVGRITNSDNFNDSITKNYNVWLTKTLNQIHEISAEQKDKTIVIYIHCDSGRDRTGMIVSAYRLLFKDNNLQEVKEKNVAEVGRNSVVWYDRAINSYCRYLKQTFSKANDYCEYETIKQSN